MAEAELPNIRVHEDPDFFREALNFTSAETLFPSRLIEKDYYCTVLLAYLASANEHLVFKGGTCLAKVHGSFYRLSEDLDFTIPMPVTASRSQRANRAVTLRNAVVRLPDKIPCFRIVEPLRGANVSTQSGDWTDAAPLDRIGLLDRIHTAIRQLNVTQARQETDRFVREKSSLELWSREFFLEIVDKIETV